MLYCHSGLQDDRALTPARHHSASRQKKGEWGIEQAVLWASPRGGVHHFHPQPLDQDPAIRPWLTSRETGKCSLAVNAQEEIERGLEDCWRSLPAPGTPNLSGARLTYFL